MGLKKIIAKKEEMYQKIKALGKIKKAVAEFVGVYETHAQECEKLEEQKEKLTQQLNLKFEKMRSDIGKIEQLPTLGVPEFEYYKKHLVELYKGTRGVRPLPFGAIDSMMVREEKAINGLMKAWLDAAAKSVPSEIKAGMVVKHSTGNVFEITGPAVVKKTSNGDVREFPVNPAEGNEAKWKSISESTLRKECKFVDL